MRETPGRMWTADECRADMRANSDKCADSNGAWPDTQKEQKSRRLSKNRKGGGLPVGWRYPKKTPGETGIIGSVPPGGAVYRVISSAVCFSGVSFRLSIFPASASPAASGFSGR